MSCSPDEFLSQAKRLSASAEEIDLRCAVSRAYYAALHWAREVEHFCPPLQAGGVRGTTHEAVIQRFLAYTANKTAIKIGYLLRDMRNRREAADYELGGVTVAGDAEYQVRAAERVRDMARSFGEQHAAGNPSGSGSVREPQREYGAAEAGLKTKTDARSAPSVG